ncbi:hypothetical protein [Shewanella sp. Isolate11]|uniref:hypothetical protein n=1 Tax=Shewanella sp. Isolate11 TaxID=2908530 RepID=UPI001EFD8C80|nr:hypothetical protein [Shewanella sp. Isolate11]MCG9697292.1 hypothetical protein [Shewanella sp. Isolate11]
MAHFFRALKWILISLIMLPISLYLLLVIINLFDTAPSEQVKAYQAQIDYKFQQIQNIGDNNGYLIALGFDAPKNESATGKGLALIRSDIRFNSPAETTNTPVKRPDIPCLKRQDFISACQSEMDSSQLSELLTEHRWLIERYLTMQSKPEWEDVLFTDVDKLHTAYALILTAQKLYLLDIYTQASAGDTSSVSQTLNHDMQFWQNVAEHTQQLITKMITSSAMRENMLQGEMIISAMNTPIESPETWLQPLPESISSFDQVKLGEWQFGNKLLEKMISVESSEIDSPWYEQLFSWFAKRLYQPQDTSNRLANNLLSESADPQCSAFLSNITYVVYNPIGKILVCTGPSFDRYKQKFEKLEQQRQGLVTRLNPINNINADETSPYSNKT